MSFKANVYKVMIASPGDVKEERDAVEKVLADWNHDYSALFKTVFIPLRWEKDSTSLLGRRPQDTINKQLCDESDLLISIFWKKFGTPTGNGKPSGTVEEINYHLADKKPVMLYFCNRAYNYIALSDDDKKQAEDLNKYKKSIEKDHSGLYFDFSTADDLQVLVKNHLKTMVTKEEPFVSDRKRLESGIQTSEIAESDKRFEEIQPEFKISIIKDQPITAEVFSQADLFNGSLNLPKHSNIKFMIENVGKYAITNVELLGYTIAEGLAPGDSEKIIIAYTGSPDLSKKAVHEIDEDKYPKDSEGYPLELKISYIDTDGNKQEQRFRINKSGKKPFYEREYTAVLPAGTRII